MVEVGLEYILSSPRSALENDLLDLLSEGAMTRSEMVKKLGIPRTTIYDALKRLIVRGLVLKYPLRNALDEGRSVRGRPRVLFDLIDGGK